MADDRSHTRSRIYDVVRRIPEGRVATYGQVARLAGLPGHARQVGYALHDARDPELPWQRVINAKGEISRRSEPGGENLQRVILEAEGVDFDDRGRIDLERFRWQTETEDCSDPDDDLFPNDSEDFP